MCAYLDELHEEMDILAVELLAEVVDGLVHVLRQWVLLAAPDVVALPPDPLHVLPRRRRRRHRRGRRHFDGSTSTGLPRGRNAAWVARKCRRERERRGLLPGLQAAFITTVITTAVLRILVFLPANNLSAATFK